MYHAVSDDLWGIPELFVSPSEMEKQLAYLEENGYDPITFEDINLAKQTLIENLMRAYHTRIAYPELK